MLLGEFTKTKLKIDDVSEGDELDMCKAIEDWIAEERTEGKAEDSCLL